MRPHRLGRGTLQTVGSPNFKLLYDIYHMQIMEGDVIATIKASNDYIAHYHTGGVPGRNEIDETQELYYPAIMRAIADTGYKGYVARSSSPSARTRSPASNKACRSAASNAYPARHTRRHPQNRKYRWAMGSTESGSQRSSPPSAVTV